MQCTISKIGEDKLCQSCYTMLSSSSDPGGLPPLLAKPKKRQINFHNWKRVVQSIHFTDGVTKLAWDPKRSCMFAGLKSGLVLLYLITFAEVRNAAAMRRACDSSAVLCAHCDVLVYLSVLCCRRMWPQLALAQLRLSTWIRSRAPAFQR